MRASANRLSSEFLPHVVAWNLTKKCNLQCTHCYISAGPWEDASDELTPAECLRVVDQLVEVNPSPMLILSGGEPLLRPDLPALAAHAVRRGCTVVVGTNGTLLTDGQGGDAEGRRSLGRRGQRRFARARRPRRASAAARMRCSAPWRRSNT